MEIFDFEKPVVTDRQLMGPSCKSIFTMFSSYEKEMKAWLAITRTLSPDTVIQ